MLQRGDGAPGWEEFMERVRRDEPLNDEERQRVERYLARSYREDPYFRELADRLIEGLRP